MKRPLMQLGCLAIAVTALLSRISAVQQQIGATFDVASVKVNVSGDVSMSISPLAGNSFSVENAQLRELIRYAYQLSDYELADAPDWIARERFDIRASTNRDALAAIPAGTSPERLMLRALLADRFKLAVHREKREAPIYSLVMARRDRQPGPELHATRTDCATLKRDANAPPRGADGSILCGIRNTGTGLAVANALSMEAFARFLSGQVRRVVVERTALAGEWDSQLRWTPDRISDIAGSDRSDAPNLFTALQEQLGLKLESTKGLVDVLVVDHVDRPTGD